MAMAAVRLNARREHTPNEPVLDGLAGWVGGKVGGDLEIWGVWVWRMFMESCVRFDVVVVCSEGHIA